MNNNHTIVPSFEEYCREIKSLWDNHNEQRAKYKKFQEGLEEFFNARHVVVYASAKVAVEYLLSSMHFSKSSSVITTSSTPTYMVRAINDYGLITKTCDFNCLKNSKDSQMHEICIPQDVTGIVTSLPALCENDIQSMVLLAQTHNLKIVLDGTSSSSEDCSYVRLPDNLNVDAIVYRFGAGTPFSSFEGAALCINDEELYTSLMAENSSGAPGITELEVDEDSMLLDELNSAMGICILSHLK